jgi:subtilisin family serine protease
VAERTGYVPRSILAMPVEGSQQTLGVLEVLDRGGTGGLGADQGQLLALFARQAALAVEQAQVFADLGRALLQAAARAAEGASLRDVLTRAAQAAPRPTAELAELRSASTRWRGLGRTSGGSHGAAGCGGGLSPSGGGAGVKPAWSWQFSPGHLRPVAATALPFPISRQWAWADSTGRGVKVAAVDSGIDPDHPAVRGAPAGWPSTTTQPPPVGCG